jgi:hypothetical protein
VPTPAPTPPTPPPTPAPPTPMPKQTYKFVATWRGSHNYGSDLGAVIGECTCALISPLWIITAGHCAERVLKKEKVDVKVGASWNRRVP